LNDSRDVDRGWTVEIALPWKALGEFAHRPSPPQNGDQWRVNFSRVQWQLNSVGGGYEKVPNRPENNWVWSPQGVIDMHRPEVWGYVEFASGTKVGPRSFFDPSWTARRILHGWYYAQREYRRKNGGWASSLEQLFPPRPNVALDDGSGVVFDAQLTVTGDQFEISARSDPRDPARWHIRQDSLFWKK